MALETALAPSGDVRPVYRRIAAALCVALALGLFLSALFIATHHNHAHDHSASDGGCAVCVHLTAAEEFLRLVSAALLGAGAALAVRGVMRAALGLAARRAPFFSPVRMRVKLNN